MPSIFDITPVTFKVARCLFSFYWKSLLLLKNETKYCSQDKFLSCFMTQQRKSLVSVLFLLKPLVCMYSNFYFRPHSLYANYALK
jgi:hypothetical protein